MYSFVHLDDAVAATQAGAGVAARLMAGRYGVHLMTTQRGADNAKAKQTLGWHRPTELADRIPDRTRIGGARPVGDSKQVRRL